MFAGLCVGVTGRFGLGVLIAAGGVVLTVVSYKLAGGARNPGVHERSVLDQLDGADRGSGEADRLRMAVCVVQLGLLMSAADGQISSREIEAIRSFFKRDGADRQFLDFIDGVIVNSVKFPDPQRVVSEVNRIASRDQKEYLLLAMLAVALADGHLDEGELAALFRIGSLIGFSHDDILRLVQSLGAGGAGSGRESSPAEPAEAERAFATLGLSVGATLADARTAYRSLAQRYHPDKVSHLGPEFAELARERMAAINAAYQQVQLSLA